MKKRKTPNRVRSSELVSRLTRARMQLEEAHALMATQPVEETRHDIIEAHRLITDYHYEIQDTIKHWRRMAEDAPTKTKRQCLEACAYALSQVG